MTVDAINKLNQNLT